MTLDEERAARIVWESAVDKTRRAALVLARSAARGDLPPDQCESFQMAQAAEDLAYDLFRATWGDT